MAMPDDGASRGVFPLLTPTAPAPELALGLWVTALQTAWLLAESQSVISHRVLGLAGLEARGPDELRRMVQEKSTAFAAAGIAGLVLVLAGRRPDEVLRAMLHPLRSTTGRNLRRLARLRQLQQGRRRAARARVLAGLRRAHLGGIAAE